MTCSTISQYRNGDLYAKEAKLGGCYVCILTHVPACRESQEFLENYEGAMGKGKHRKLYACTVIITKVRNLIFIIEY